MRVTDHFRQEVVGPDRLAGREGITCERCIEIVRDPRYRRREGEERVFWGYAPELPGRTKWLKVVTDARLEVLITAHKDRKFARMVERGEV